MSQNLISKWQTPELAHTFLEGVRGAIPGADLQFAVIAKITSLWTPSPKRILDLGCGNGILGKFLLAIYPAAAGVFLDFSEPMLHAARKNVGINPNVTFSKADFGSPQWLSVANPHGPFDVVVSGFAIHHQSDTRKRELYREIYDLLTPGGVFLNLEHVASASDAGETLFDDFFIDHLYAFHSKSNPDANRSSIAGEYYGRPDKKENILARVENQCRWLTKIGFEDVDCFFKVFELAIFGGRKPSSNSVEPISLRSMDCNGH